MLRNYLAIEKKKQKTKPKSLSVFFKCVAVYVGRVLTQWANQTGYWRQPKCQPLCVCMLCIPPFNFWHADAALSSLLACKHLKNKYGPSLRAPSFSLLIGPCKQDGANKPFLGKPPQQLETVEARWGCAWRFPSSIPTHGKSSWKTTPGFSSTPFRTPTQIFRFLFDHLQIRPSDGFDDTPDLQKDFGTPYPLSLACSLGACTLRGVGITIWNPLLSPRSGTRSLHALETTCFTHDRDAACSSKLAIGKQRLRANGKGLASVPRCSIKVAGGKNCHHHHHPVPQPLP